MSRLLSNLKIAHKLVLFYVFAIILFAGMGLLNYYLSGGISHNIQEMYENRVISISILNECRIKFKEIESLTLQILTISDNKSKQINLLALLETYHKDIEGMLAKYETRELDELEKQWLVKLKNEYLDYYAALSVSLDTAFQNKQNEAYDNYMAYGYKHVNNINMFLQILSDYSKEKAENQYWEANQLADQSFFVIILIPFIGAFFILVLGYFINKYLTNPLHTLLKEIQKVANGNFENMGNRIQTFSNDEIGQLAQSFNNMSQTISDYMKELYEKNEIIKNQANEDPLTNLPNRRMFNEKLSSSIREAELKKSKLAVFYIDLDNFKKINDTMGHIRGDELLIQAAHRLRNRIPRNHLLARLGGDEFTISIPNIKNREEAQTYAENVNRILAEPFWIQNQEINITASIGISIYPDDGMDDIALFGAADMALYHSKKMGRNTFQFYSEGLHNISLKRAMLEDDFRKAVYNEELVLYYQPVIDTTSQVIIGMEALVRWNHHREGLLLPENFLSLAEETGLIIPLTDWILKSTCLQNKSWQDAGYSPIFISVNIPSSQLYMTRLPAKLQVILQETKLDPRWLNIEIAEGNLIENKDETISLLTKLKEIGVKISIDHFGSGLLLLKHLRDLPIDSLKTDSAIFKELTSNPREVKMAQSIIDFAANMGMTVVVEGVETAEHLVLLKELNCHQAQGVYFSEPLSAEKIKKELVKRGQSKKD